MCVCVCVCMILHKHGASVYTLRLLGTADITACPAAKHENDPSVAHFSHAGNTPNLPLVKREDLVAIETGSFLNDRTCRLSSGPRVNRSFGDNYEADVQKGHYVIDTKPLVEHYCCFSCILSKCVLENFNKKEFVLYGIFCCMNLAPTITKKHSLCCI